MRWWFTASEHEVKIVLLLKLNQNQNQILLDHGSRPVHCSHQGAVGAGVPAPVFSRSRPPTRRGGHHHPQCSRLGACTSQSASRRRICARSKVKAAALRLLTTLSWPRSPRKPPKGPRRRAEATLERHSKDDRRPRNSKRGRTEHAVSGNRKSGRHPHTYHVQSRQDKSHYILTFIPVPSYLRIRRPCK